MREVPVRGNTTKGALMTVRYVKMLVVALLLAVGTVSTVTALATIGAVKAEAAVVSNIEVRGNTRMDADTIRSFLTIEPGENFTNADIDDSVKALFGTGLFADVSIYRSGSTLVVEVDENATINEVFFEGNKRLKDEPLSAGIQSRSRGIYSPETVASDVNLIQEAYSRVGRGDAIVTSEVVPLANNRVNIVFRVNEGGKTKIRSITFIGNEAYGQARLREVMSTKRSNFLSWLKNDDIYDPDRLATDEERLRRFYYNNGYADFQILSSSAVLDEAANAYDITFTVDEGGKYRFGEIAIESTLPNVDTDALYSRLETRSGNVYKAEDVEDSIIALTEAVAADGYAFVDVVPRGNRDFANGTIDVTYLIDQGARVYVERIVIVGNERTREYVIRREFDISEGDAFNQVYIQNAKRRLDRLGIFDRVDVSTRSGSAPDRVVVVVRITEKATGEFSIGGGYSTSGGALAEIGFTEKNFMGRGQLLRITGKFGEEETSYRLSFTEPYFLGYRVSAGFDLGYTETDSSDSRAYESENLYGVLRFGVPLTNNLRFTPSYQFSQESTTISGSKIDTGPGDPSPSGNGDGVQGNADGEISTAFAPPLSPSDWTRSGFGYSLTYSSLDDLITPREGARYELSQVAYGAGGDATYLRSEVKGQVYMPISEELDLIGMVDGRAGAITPYGDDDGFRALDNFFQGSKQIRGFKSNGFGPRDPGTGDALGGMYYWNATAEMNFPAPFLPESYGIRGAVFADAGQLWGVDSESRSAIKAANGSLSSAMGNVDDEAMRASVGASIIWNSPFGPLRFDYAEPVIREDYDELRRFSFGISSTF